MFLNVMPGPGLGGFIDQLLQMINCLSFGECIVIQ